MPREAPEIRMTRPWDASSLARSSEQSLVDAAVVDDVLAGHEAGLGAADIGYKVAALARIGKAAGRASFSAGSSTIASVGGVAALGMAVQVSVECVRCQTGPAHGVDGDVVRDQLAHHRCHGARQRQPRRMAVREVRPAGT